MGASSPEACDELFARYVNAGEIDLLADLYEPGAALVPAPGQVVVGRAAIRETLSDLIAMKPNIKCRVTSVLQADDIAVLYNDWRGTLVDADGERTETAGQAIEIVRRQSDGSWRFAVDDPYARG